MSCTVRRSSSSGIPSPWRITGRTMTLPLAITLEAESLLRTLAAAARELGVRTIALTGNGGGKMGALASPDDVHICVPHKRTARIQEVHLLVLHCLCDGIDFQLSGVRP